MMIRNTFNQARCFFLHLVYISWSTPVKYINDKFAVFTDIHACTGYFIGFTFSENVALLVFASHLS